MSRHGPNRWLNYKSIHDTAMQQFYDRGIVRADNLIWLPYDGRLLLSGEISMLGDIGIKVRKVLAGFDGTENPEVWSIHYAYNAFVRRHHEFLRYDNGPHPVPNAIDAHHRHEKDWRTGVDVNGSPWWVGAELRPTLGQFIIEVEHWYYSHIGDPLPNPYGWSEPCEPHDYERST